MLFSLSLQMESLFLVCLIPPADIVKDVDEIRKFISEKFNVHESLKRPAHITLYDPLKLTSLNQENIFFQTLQNLAYFDPFKQVLKNFGSFNEHTFYIDVEQNENIMQLKKAIDSALKPLKLLNTKNHLKFTPHLTLAFKDVRPEVFRAINIMFKDKRFKREFIVSGFSVYKHIDKRWQPYRFIPFQSPDERPRPLTLF